MSTEFRRLSGRMAYSSPPHWRLDRKRSMTCIRFNLKALMYPLIYLFIGVAVFYVIASRNEDVREALTLSQIHMIVALLFFVPIIILAMTYLFFWRGKPWLMYDERELVVHLPRLGASVPVESVVAVQCLSGYLDFSGGHRRRWVSEIRIIIRDGKECRVVPVVGTTVLGVASKTARKLAQAFHVDVIVEDED